MLPWFHMPTVRAPHPHSQVLAAQSEAAAMQTTLDAALAEYAAAQAADAAAQETEHGYLVSWCAPVGYLASQLRRSPSTPILPLRADGRGRKAGADCGGAAQRGTAAGSHGHRARGDGQGEAGCNRVRRQRVAAAGPGEGACRVTRCASSHNCTAYPHRPERRTWKLSWRRCVCKQLRQIQRRGVKLPS